MQVTFTFDSRELQRLRYIEVKPHKKPPYIIPPTDPSYENARLFLQRHATGGFPFELINLLHTTAVKKLAYPATVQRFLKRSLLITGGLYLALNPRHRDLEIREIMGDFASGFSHDFGVGLTLLAASNMFDVPLDELNPIKRQNRKPSLDYAALLPDNQGLLLVEAKGVTSDESRSESRRKIAKKKQASGNTVMLESGKTLYSEQVIKIGIIVQAACRNKQPNPPVKKRGPKRRELGLLEIIDPEPNDQLRRLPKEHFIAGNYWHYAGVALFAGLPHIAEEFALRATALIEGKKRTDLLTDYHFDNDMVFHRQNRQLVGMQWQLSDLPLGSEDVWFYQAADLNHLRTLLVENYFPQTTPYRPDTQRLIQDNLAESLLSDGSYFGIGVHQQRGLRFLSAETDIGPEQDRLW